MSRWRFVLGALVLAWPLAASQSPEPALRDRAGFVPRQRYVPLKGKAVGVLVSDVKAVMAHDGRGGPADAVAFSAGNASYRWMYVPARGRPLITGLQVDVGDRLGKKRLYPALDMANAAALKGSGITPPYALVEVEVNDGLGSPPVEGFVATKLTRLDGTRRYPLDVAKVIAARRDTYKAHLKGRQAAVEGVLAAEAKQALKGRKVTGPRETQELMYVTWLPQTERLRVVFRTTVSDGAYQWVGGGARGGPQPGKRPPPRDGRVRVGVTFGVEFGMAYEVDRTGKTVATQTLAPQGFSRELPPPPGR